MKRTRLFHSVVIVGSGLLASCGKTAEQKAPPAAGSSARPADAAASPDAEAEAPAPAADAAIDASAPVDAGAADAAAPTRKKKTPPLPEKLRKAPDPTIIMIYRGDGL